MSIFFQDKRLTPPWYLWLNVASLDAPLVAVVWQEAFCRGLGINLGWVPRFVTAGCVWLAYAGDRLLDGEAIGPVNVATDRHRFALQYRKVLARIWVCVFFIVGWSAFFVMRNDLVRSGLILSGTVAAYFLVVHWPGRKRMPGGIKEFCVGMLFAIGSVTFVLARGNGLPIGGAAALLLFGSVCFLNCAGIGFWEAEFDSVQSQVSLALAAPSLRRFFFITTLFVAGMAGAIGIGISMPSLRPVFLALMLSAFLLGALDHFSFLFDPQELRAAADLVLLSPIVFLPWSWS